WTRCTLIEGNDFYFVKADLRVDNHILVRRFEKYIPEEYSTVYYNLDSVSIKINMVAIDELYIFGFGFKISKILIPLELFEILSVFSLKIFINPLGNSLVW